MNMKGEIERKLKKYFEITGKAIDIAKKAINEKRKNEAVEVLEMASRYYDDAKFFEKQGQIINAFAALNYAHGWLDCGSRLRLFKVKDSKLFVVK
ncbi:MAG: DUF357 domain-containing protein [Candidatus Pacearchaeota archaeon]|nr:DUF357 domain-containing protein [Candidatus Pacearchaeota archaeon]